MSQRAAPSRSPSARGVPRWSVAAQWPAIPSNGVARAGWSVYALHLLPLASSVISPGWKEVGRFLGPSIMSFNERFPPPVLEDLWTGAGMHDVCTRRLTWGAGVVTWGTKAGAR